MLEGHEYDSRWTVKDKIRQYRGLLALCERDKEKSNKDFEVDKTQTNQKLSELKNEVRLLRLLLQDTSKGEYLRTVIQDDRRLALAIGGKSPLELVEDLHQRNCTKVREINKLQYVKNLKMEELEKAMVEIVEIKKRIELNSTVQPDTLRKQILIKEIEKTNIRYNAAKCVHDTYEKMINLMKEDALYLDHIVASMSLDANEQSQSIARVKEKGERAAAENERAREELQNLEEKTVSLIRMRDRAIRQLRQQINSLRARLKTMGSEESDAQNKVFKLEMLTQVNVDESDDVTPFTLKILEKGMQDLQDVTMVTDYKNIFSRLQDQLEQRQRLLMQATICEQHRGCYNDKLYCLKESLDKIQHTQSEECKRHEKDEEKFRDKLRQEKTRKETSNQLVEDLTKKLLYMRVVIISLHEVVGRVKTPDEIAKATEIVNEMTFKEIMSQIANPFETLELIKEKVRKLRNEIGLAVENWPENEINEAEREMEEMKEKQTPEMQELLKKEPMIADVAKKEYHDKVTEHIARAHFGGATTYLYNLDEVPDNEAGVISRAEIKLASRRLVKDSEMPLFGLAAKKGARNLHKRNKPKRRKWTL